MYIITARPYTKDGSQYTVNELEKAQIQAWDGLYMMPSNMYDGTKQSIAKFKTLARSMALENAGPDARIICNVGNAWQDVVDPTVMTSFAKADPSKTYVYKTSNGAITMKLPETFTQQAYTITSTPAHTSNIKNV
jgi:hypothetical protein